MLGPPAQLLRSGNRQRGAPCMAPHGQEKLRVSWDCGSFAKAGAGPPQSHTGLPLPLTPDPQASPRDPLPGQLSQRLGQRHPEPAPWGRAWGESRGQGGGTAGRSTDQQQGRGSAAPLRAAPRARGAAQGTWPGHRPAAASGAGGQRVRLLLPSPGGASGAAGLLQMLYSLAQSLNTDTKIETVHGPGGVFTEDRSASPERGALPGWRPAPGAKVGRGSGETVQPCQ